MFDPDRHIDPKHFPRNQEFKNCIGLKNQSSPESRKENQHSNRSEFARTTEEDTLNANLRPSDDIVDRWKLPMRRWKGRVLRIFQRKSRVKFDQFLAILWGHDSEVELSLSGRGGQAGDARPVLRSRPHTIAGDEIGPAA